MQLRSKRMICLGMTLLLAGCSTRSLRETPTTPPPVVPPPINHSILQVKEGKTCPVILVQATSSAPNEAERSYAAKITARMANWLQESGIPTSLITDDQVINEVGSTTKVMILPSNPSPGMSEIKALHRFVERGGKLIVMYSADPKLADLMGLKLGLFTSSTGTDCWNAMRFVDGAPRGAPSRVEQESRNIRPVYPKDSHSQVIAWWETASGRGPREPAWVQSDHGFWMSHILLESDVAAKKQLLVSLAGACDKSLWRAAANYSVKHAGTLGLYPTASRAITAIDMKARQGKPNGVVQVLLNQAEHLQDQIIQDYQTDNYSRVLGTARHLDSVLTEAYARTQTSKKGEFRGVWNHSGTGFTPGQWNETCQTLAHSGMTAILPNVQRPWCAHYPGKLIPASDTLTRYGDQLRECLTAAHRNGLETHAWVILWSLDGAPDSVIAGYLRAGRLQMSASGSPVTWLCPSNPDNRAFELSALRDMVARYPALDGVQLDYIRYKSLDTCYCSGCRARFTGQTGIQVKHWPSDVRSGVRSSAYRQWRRDQITRFVADAHREIDRINPRIKLSASVYAGYPGCADSIAQDWAAWLQRGLVDFVCPMNYTADPGRFIEWYRKQVAYPGVRGKLFAGIGVTSLECRLSAVKTINQISLLRGEGATGFTLFEANPTLKTDVLPYLTMGLTASHD